MATILYAARALSDAMAGLHIEGEIVVLIPEHEWSRFCFSAIREVETYAMYADGKVRNGGPFQQIKMAGVNFRSLEA
jgi:hypothetical protein